MICPNRIAPILILAGAWLYSPSSVADDASRLILKSVNEEARVALTCSAPKTIDVVVAVSQRPPVILAPDYTAGAGNKGAVRYTVDGTGPFLEEWQLRDDGVTPRDREQLRDFLSRLGAGHVMFIGIGGMTPAEFQLGKYSSHLKNFATACLQKP